MKAESSRKTDKHYLLVASTERELSFFRRHLRDIDEISLLCCGVGLTEAAYTLTCYLAGHHQNPPAGVINFGIGGAYPGNGIELLDLCLATREVLADLGVCYPQAIDFLTDQVLNIEQEFELTGYSMFGRASDLMVQSDIPFHQGVFVSLNCASGTSTRGMMLRDRHQGICENMEGAALARVCRGFELDFLELRTISNIVEDRVEITSRWPIDEACEKGADQVMRTIKGFLA